MKQIPMKLWVSFMLLAAVVGWWSSSHRQNIQLFERYGVEWGSPMDLPIRLSPQAGLRAPFVAGRAYRFTPMVRNGSNAVLKHVEVWIDLGSEVRLSLEELPLHWSAGQRTWIGTGLPPIDPHHGMGAYESLWLMFPAPGTYAMEGRLNAVWRGREVVVPSKWELRLE